MSSRPSILLAGCGKMGGALLDGWLASPIPPRLVVLDRHRAAPSNAKTDDAATGNATIDGGPAIVRTAADIPADFYPDLIVLAVKPAAADIVIDAIGAALGPRLSGSAILSVMAGRTCAALSEAARNAGADIPVLRAMPNTPSAIGAGISALYASPTATKRQKTLCHALLSAVGDVVPVMREEDLSAVTALSGSGPAYVFLLAELLERAGRTHGLPAETARRLARGTIYGAGRMLDELPDNADDLRRAVTSPNGTTAAALNVLMAPDAWPRTVSDAIDAATKRADELAG